MTSYFSASFLAVFLPAVVIVYALVPRRARWVVLLAASYAFFLLLSKRLVLYLVASTVSVYVVALGLQALKDRGETGSARMRWLAFLGVAFNVALLAACKYLPFFGRVATAALRLVGMGVTVDPPTFAAPIGISFYTLMAVSYVADVYRGKVRADANLGRVALYLSFFPQAMEGPIARYDQTAARLTAGEPVCADNLYAGTQRILFGLAKKVVVADRLNPFVKAVFEGYASYDGGIIALAAVLYTMQLYCDFSGTMDVALGMAQIFGVRLPENFRQPFFSRTASEFWRRWHVTLGAWLRDYVYYPVSLSRPVKRLTRKARRRLGRTYGPLLASSVALLLVWLANGLWHGAGSQYLFFGMYYFVLILAGGLVEPVARRVSSALHINRDSAPYRTFQVLRTLVVVVVGELFFRAQGLHAGLEMFGRMVTNFSLASFANGTFLNIGLDSRDFLVVGEFAVLLFLAGILRERGKGFLDILCNRPRAVQLAAWVGAFVVVTLLGAYGVGYVPVSPMYASF